MCMLIYALAMFSPRITFCFAILIQCATSSNRPNIIFILADDLGWDDVSFHGSTQIPTPNIDALAASGILLNNYYVQHLCTPSRAALLTSKHPIQLGLQHNVLDGSQPYGLGLNETLLPQYLKDLGYKTHMVGKWHLGFVTKEYTPTYRGFDSHYGYYQGDGDYFVHTYQLDYSDLSLTWGYDFWNNTEIDKSAIGLYSTGLYTNETIRIISRHDQSEPLFLYLPHQAVHSGNSEALVKLQAPPEYVKKFEYIENEERRHFAAMLSALDDSVGNVLEVLSNHGLLKNSIVVFSTDNGGPANHQDWNAACNWPLRGSKRTMWEGGVRGNGIIWSPLLQKSGYVSEHMIQITDWLPTLLEAAGFDISNLPKDLYGISQWQALANNSPGPRKEMLHNIDSINGDGALRQGDLKVVFGAGATLQYDGWFLPDTVEANMTDMKWSFKGHTGLNEEYNTKFRSMYKTLSYKDKETSLHPLKVYCGGGHGDPRDCQPWLSPCLFNITADPCEFHNLADKHPDIVSRMIARVREYQDMAAVPLNKNVPQGGDRLGWPGLNGGVWKPWRTL